mmetsp:Transcript_128101/g.292746  ORF Transcript_128101/g.292746 Transcript_128101/m.292746 type:complete len:289 (+) Transcript_128101:1392-2258(+)
MFFVLNIFAVQVRGVLRVNKHQVTRGQRRGASNRRAQRRRTCGLVIPLCGPNVRLRSLDFGLFLARSPLKPRHQLRLRLLLLMLLLLMVVLQLLLVMLLQRLRKRSCGVRCCSSRIFRIFLLTMVLLIVELGLLRKVLPALPRLLLPPFLLLLLRFVQIGLLPPLRLLFAPPSNAVIVMTMTLQRGEILGSALALPLRMGRSFPSLEGTHWFTMEFAHLSLRLLLLLLHLLLLLLQFGLIGRLAGGKPRHVGPIHIVPLDGAKITRSSSTIRITARRGLQIIASDRLC